MKPKQLFFGLVGIGIVLVAGSATAYYFGLQSLNQKLTQTRDKLVEVEVADARLLQLQQLNRQYLAAQVDLSRLEEALPHQKRQSEIVLQLEQLARTAGMSLPGVSFLGVQALPGPTTQSVAAGDALALPITLSLSGTYAQLQTFLRSVESLGRYSNISQITIGKAGGRTLTFSLTLNTYYKP